ncbi:hypothetical protein MMC16_005116 [Acarospora aff. strigata]|nr:hypothetical protein [Acarospora aff. strigata]
MTAKLLLVFGLCAFAFAAPPHALFDRALGDSCKAPEGTGSCRNTSACKGISYPTGLCPKDPKDVQCCVEITCSASGGNGFCRSVKNNGCSGGSFVAGRCPGSKDIQCCIKAAGPKPSPKPQPPAWPACWKTLSCTFGQIAASSMADRLAFVRYMQTNFFGKLNAGNQFRAIEGVITFFQKNSLGAPESWVSYVDAGIVEGIERGGAIALGMSTEDGGNKGSALWASFLSRKRDGQLNDLDTHDKAWSEAEQASTEYAVARADAKFQRSARERNWYWTTQLFRWIMRNRGKAITALRFVLFTKADDFVNWLTNIADAKPAECMSETGWFFAGQLDGLPDLGDLNELRKILPKLKKCFEG